MKPHAALRHPLALPAITGCCLALACCTALTGAADPFDGARYENAPQIINVSSWDPKERQRHGDGFTPDNLGALRRSGALGLIARNSKGMDLDKETHRFLAAADREGMLLGAYHFLLPESDAVEQADLFVGRVHRIARDQRLRNPQILMVGDLDPKTRRHEMVRFILRMRELTGRFPIIYLENSDSLKTELRDADPRTRRILRQCPYWMALYSHVDSGKSRYSSPHPLTPRRLLAIYDTWDTWALWQYGGVHWDARRGRSVPHHYAFSSFQSPRYFGNLDRPTERNVFNGSQEELFAFWKQNAWTWK